MALAQPRAFIGEIEKLFSCQIFTTFQNISGRQHTHTLCVCQFPRFWLKNVELAVKAVPQFCRIPSGVIYFSPEPPEWYAEPLIKRVRQFA